MHIIKGYFNYQNRTISPLPPSTSQIDRLWVWAKYLILLDSRITLELWSLELHSTKISKIAGEKGDFLGKNGFCFYRCWNAENSQEIIINATQQNLQMINPIIINKITIRNYIYVYMNYLLFMKIRMKKLYGIPYNKMRVEAEKSLRNIILIS